MSLCDIFMVSLPEFSPFLESRPSYESLGESLDIYRRLQKSNHKLNKELDDKIRGAYIHYAKSLQVPSCPIIQVKDLKPETVSHIEEFDLLASQSIYKGKLSEQLVKDVVFKYYDDCHPYICSELSRVFLAGNDFDTGLHFHINTLRYLKENPEELWNDPFGVYGIAMLLDTLVSNLSKDHWIHFDNRYAELLKTLVELTYLFLSRVICWPENKMATSDGLSNLPVSYFHKRSCCLLRKSLLHSFPEVFEEITPSLSTVGTLQVSDYYTAHLFSFNKLGDRGKKSEMKKYAKELYSKYQSDDIRPFNTAIEDGWIDSVELAYRYYLRYIAYPVNLNETLYVELLKSVSANIRDKKQSVETKKDSKAIGDYLKENDITYFYHFTEEKNLDNIRRYGGLLSQYQCVMQAIPVHTEASNTMIGLREKDNKFNLEDYARLSFCTDHPLKDKRGQQGARLVRLKIRTDIAFLKDTLFSDRDAASEHHHGPGLEDLKMVDFNATSKIVHFDVDPEELCLKNQAEILVRSMIPKDYIINLDNPDII